MRGNRPKPSRDPKSPEPEVQGEDKPEVTGTNVEVAKKARNLYYERLLEYQQRVAMPPFGQRKTP